MLTPMFSPEQLRVAREMGIVDDDVLAEVLRRELSCQDSGHLRNVLRVLVMSHIAANERMRELANTVDHHT